ncbi:MAG: hypothetical protein ACYC5K_03790 [Saccharofermentanales bacterium]
MKNIQIRCDHQHRLFDAVEGSSMKIRYKCSNQKVCPNKKACRRLVEISFVDDSDNLSGLYREVKCPSCGKRLFDATTDSVGIITIKCESCGKISIVLIFVV